MVEGVLRRQAGVISREQALAGGLSAQQISRRLTAGRWESVRPRVYLARDREYTDEARIRAAWLWAGESATISGLAAAWWHGLWPEPPPMVDITVPLGRSISARGVRIRRRDLAEVDRVGVRSLWVTGVPLTALEAAVALGKQGSRLLDRALQRGVHFDAVYRAHCRNLGRRGSGAAAVLLAGAADRAASTAERKLIALLRAGGIQDWVQHYRTGGFELDFAFPASRLAVEVDGWAWHQDEVAFRRDRQRQNLLVLAGWTVLRFSWHDLTQRPGEVINEIRFAHDRQK